MTNNKVKGSLSTSDSIFDELDDLEGLEDLEFAAEPASHPEKAKPRKKRIRKSKAASKRTPADLEGLSEQEKDKKAATGKKQKAAPKKIVPESDLEKWDDVIRPKKVVPKKVGSRKRVTKSGRVKESPPVAAKKAEVKNVTLAKKTQSTKKIKVTVKGTPIVETRREKKVKPAEKPVPKGLTQEALNKKFLGTEVLKRDPVVKDFNWRPLKRKRIWDGAYGMWLSRDPVARFKNYPRGFVVDPVTFLPMTRVKSYDRFLLVDDYDERKESMFKINRKTYLKENPEAQYKGKAILPIEYFAISSDRKFCIAISFGTDGKSPADVLTKARKKALGL